MTEQIHAENKHCLNCGHKLSGNYCEKCGQSASTKRINFKETTNDFLKSTFSLEGPLLLTIKLLLTNPGKLLREFIAGKRKSYYKPVAFFVLSSAIYLIVRALIGFDQLKGEFDEGVENIPEKGVEVFQMMSKNINNILFLLVFSIGLVLKLLFTKKYNLAEYTTIGFFITGIYILTKTIIMLIAQYLWPGVLDMEFFILFLLIFYSAFSFFQKKNFWSFIKYALAGGLSIFLYVMLSVLFFFVVVSLK